MRQYYSIIFLVLIGAGSLQATIKICNHSEDKQIEITAPCSKLKALVTSIQHWRELRGDGPVEHVPLSCEGEQIVTIDVYPLLPEGAKRAFRPANIVGPNCFNTTFIETGFASDWRYTDDAEMKDFLGKCTMREEGATKHPGDIVAVFDGDSQEKLLHTYTVLTDDFVYQKEDHSQRSIAGISTMSKAMSRYQSNAPCSGDLRAAAGAGSCTPMRTNIKVYNCAGVPPRVLPAGEAEFVVEINRVIQLIDVDKLGYCSAYLAEEVPYAFGLLMEMYTKLDSENRDNFCVRRQSYLTQLSVFQKPHEWGHGEATKREPEFSGDPIALLMPAAGTVISAVSSGFGFAAVGLGENYYFSDSSSDSSDDDDNNSDDEDWEVIER